MKQSRPLRGAWLVTWEGMGDHARIEEGKSVVAILNYRWTGERVRDFVEQLYVSLTCGAWDKLALAHDKRSNPYPALFGTIDGIPWTSEVVCGHNPWLHARRVRNLRVVLEEDGSQRPLWEPVSRPAVPRLTNENDA